VSLSVEQDSRAVAFYERNGFERVREAAGGAVMRRSLLPEA
jgi:ribosomal protein S18 acetylase RimI-like enzyme